MVSGVPQLASLGDAVVFPLVTVGERDSWRAVSVTWTLCTPRSTARLDLGSLVHLCICFRQLSASARLRVSISLSSAH